jgi:hypothetical protein
MESCNWEIRPLEFSSLRIKYMDPGLGFHSPFVEEDICLRISTPLIGILDASIRMKNLSKPLGALKNLLILFQITDFYGGL